MKTFKLKSINIVAQSDGKIVYQPIDFIDALVIDRENDDEDWLIEIFLPGDHQEIFRKLKAMDKFLLQVKISKKSNDPAVFITSIKSLTQIDENFNVVCQATLVERESGDIEQLFAHLNRELVTDIKQID